MSANPTQEQLRQASAEHVRSARALLVSNKGNKSSKQNLTGSIGVAPNSATYLAHIALECAIKLKLMVIHSRVRTEEMRKALGEDLFQTLFRSKHGHDLRLLSNHATLSRRLAASGQGELLTRTAWSRMTSSERPFDLRYGTATMSHDDAVEEVEVAQAIILALFED